MVAMALIIIGCFIDICTVELSSVWVYFRAFIWVFLVNTLIAIYGFIIVGKF